MKKYTRIKEIPEGKIKVLEEIAELIKNKKTFMIASIKNLPDKQFQEIKKQLRGKAEIKVLKKKIAQKAIVKVEKGRLMEMKKYVGDNCVLLFSDLDAFELSGELSENKSPVKAKPGQIADEDIIIESGPTELVPGPAISELGNAGIKIIIEDGKISIKEKKILVKAGDAVKDKDADVLAKLSITPFNIGLEPLAAYDKESDEVFVNIKIDKEKTIKEIVNASRRVLAFAFSIGYICKETINLLLAKAGLEEKALERLIKKENSGEAK